MYAEAQRRLQLILHHDVFLCILPLMTNFYHTQAWSTKYEKEKYVQFTHCDSQTLEMAKKHVPGRDL